MAAEKLIQKAIMQYLAVKGHLFKRNNSGLMFGTNAKGKRWAMHIGEAGWPDIIGLTKEGRFFGIEVKRPGNKPTEVQAAMLKRIRDFNGLAIVAYGIEDVQAAGL